MIELIVFENEYLLKSNELNFLHGVKDSSGVMKNEKISSKCQSGQLIHTHLSTHIHTLEKLNSCFGFKWPTHTQTTIHTKQIFINTESFSLTFPLIKKKTTTLTSRKTYAYTQIDTHLFIKVYAEKTDNIQIVEAWIIL